MKSYRFILLLLILTFSIQISAQLKLAPFRNSEGLWGYVNAKGEVILDAKYANAKPFSDDGFALVKDVVSGEYFYINTVGEKLILDCSPLAFKKFHGGRALVKIDEAWGYIDTEGKLVIAATYIRATHFADDRAFVVDHSEKTYLINPAAEKIDLNGLEITAFNEFSEGMARVRIGKTWGFIDKSGKLVIDARYEKVGNFKNGIVWVRESKGKTGFIDKQGKVVIPMKYDVVKNFDAVSGLARVKDNKEWFYIDKAQKEFKFKLDRFNDFSEGLLSADKSSYPGLFGFMNASGEWVIEPKYESTGDFHDGVCRVRVNGMWGLINTSGEYIIEPKYDRLEDFDEVEEE